MKRGWIETPPLNPEVRGGIFRAYWIIPDGGRPHKAAKPQVFEGCSFYQGCRRIAPASDGERAIPLHPCAIDRPRPSCILRLSLAAPQRFEGADIHQPAKRLRSDQRPDSSPQLVARSGEILSAKASQVVLPRNLCRSSLPATRPVALADSPEWIPERDCVPVRANNVPVSPDLSPDYTPVRAWALPKHKDSCLPRRAAVVNPPNDKKARQPSGISRQSPGKCNAQRNGDEHGQDGPSIRRAVRCQRPPEGEGLSRLLGDGLNRPHGRALNFRHGDRSATRAGVLAIVGD